MIKGILIGIGMIFPGVSGGVLAVILGVYETIIYSINNFKKDVKGNIKFLLPLFLGVILGAILSAKVLKYVFDLYYNESCYFFVGLVLGSVPYLFREVKMKEKSGVNYIALIIAFILSLVLTVFSNNNIDFSANLNNDILSFFKLFLTGFIFISGKIIPGISSSFMLMMIGMYQYFLNIMSNPLTVFSTGFYEITPLVLGTVVGAIFFVKLTAKLLKNYYRITYSIIIGFVLGSLMALYPGKINLIYIIFMIIGFIVSYKIPSMNSNKK